MTLSRRDNRAFVWSSLFVSLALIALFAWHVAHRTEAIDEAHFRYYDHHRHILVSATSLREGPRIYSRPWHELVPPGELDWGWGDVPYLYPPGALVLYLPGALASKVLPLRLIGHLYILLFAAASTLGARKIWLFGMSTSLDASARALWFLLAYAYLLQAITWSFVGQYEPVVVLFLVYAGTARAPANRVLLLAIAIFLKFQAILFLPFLLRELLEVGELRRNKRVVLGGVLVALSLATAGYLGLTHRLSVPGGTPLLMAQWRTDTRTAMCLAVTAAIVLAALARRRWEAALTIAWAFFAFASLPMVQAWYGLYLHPLATVTRGPSRGWVIGWVLAFTYLVAWFPDLYVFTENVMFPMRH